MSSIAFVGAGPTTLYALNALLARAARGLNITVFEAEAAAGVGSPYRTGWNDPAMLSNIASVEIPPVTETLLGWLQGRTEAELAELGVNIAEVDDRTFVPRIVLGRFFEDQFAILTVKARRAGMAIEVRTGCRVVDAVNRVDGMELSIRTVNGDRTTTARFDRVVLATGHQWPSRQEIRPGYFASPWPAAGLAAVGPTAVGIRGSSLTAIDTAFALAGRHGAFVRKDGRLVYEPKPGTDGFSLTMMSRKGLLPEADFYFPLPHAPLVICTPRAVAALIDQGGADLLDRTFDLFRRELMALDPAYAASTGLATASPEAFGEAYFAARAAADPFEWAAANLEEARAGHRSRQTVAWRDGILRMHEVVAAIVPHLDARQFRRFNRSLKPVFVDAYGAVPHESIERVLALHDAGRLTVLPLGDRYRLDPHCPEGGARLILDDDVRHFPVFIEATGQGALSAIQFPFLSLIEQGIVRDAPSDEAGPPRGIVVDDDFNVTAAGLPKDRLFCLSLPWLLGRHPFVQGVTSSRDMGEVVARRLVAVAGADGAAVDTLSAVA